MSEQIITPAGDDGAISRLSMPQVDAVDLPELFVFLGTLGIGLAAGLKHPREVKAHQAINVERAMAIPPKVLAFPILLSSDDYVIDGDHRWYRHCVDGTDLPFIRIEAPFLEALKHIFAFPKTYKEKEA